jgi:hypothetical protein
LRGFESLILDQMLLVIGFLGDGEGLGKAACSEISFGLTEMPERVTGGGSLSARKLGKR